TLFRSLFTTKAWAQVENKPIINSTLKGRVLDEQTKDLLIGVSLQIKGTSHGTTTDANGEFNFITGQKLPYTIIVSYIGFEKKEVLATGSPLEILLKEVRDELSEVVVVGYGTQKKVNLTGSVSSLDQKELANRPITNSTQA